MRQSLPFAFRLRRRTDNESQRGGSPLALKKMAGVGRVTVSRKRLEVDWVAVLVNTTLLIAAMMFLVVVGAMAWTLY